MAGYSLQTVERTLQLLDTFAFAPAHSWSLTELSRVLGANKTSVLRMLSTLEQHGYLVREGQNPGSRYLLGPSALALGGAASRSRVRDLERLT